MRRESLPRIDSAPPRRQGRWASLTLGRTGVVAGVLAGVVAFGGLAALASLTGCAPSNDLQPANTQAHPVLDDQSRNDHLADQIAEIQGRQEHDTVLPIFPIGDDYRLLELPDNNATPANATETNGKHVPVAFYIPPSAETVTGHPEKLNRLAAGVLYRDVSGPQPIYRLADFSRAKLGSQLVQKAFNTFAHEKGVELPDDLKLTDGYPAIFSAAYIYRDTDMIEKAPANGQKTTAPAPTDSTTAKPDDKAPGTRKVRIIRTDDMDGFLKENKADVLALLVVEVDEQHGQEHLVALWLWGRDPITRGLFSPSACIQAKKIDDAWPEASESEMISAWHSLIDLERRLIAAKTVTVNLPHKSTP